MTLAMQCTDFLAGNGHLYAVKARRKQIAIVRLNLASSKLIEAGKTYDACDRDAAVKRLGEFT